MGDRENKVNEFFHRSRLTLDLAGLTDEERQAGSIFLGGGAAEFVDSVENFQYDRIGTVVFRWGDEKAEDTFAALLEHIEPPNDPILPFKTSVVIGTKIWILALQAKDFLPDKAYTSTEEYVEIPFDPEEAEAVITEAIASGKARQLIGKVGLDMFYLKWLQRLVMSFHQNRKKLNKKASLCQKNSTTKK